MVDPDEDFERPIKWLHRIAGLSIVIGLGIFLAPLISSVFTNFQISPTPITIWIGQFNGSASYLVGIGIVVWVFTLRNHSI